VVSETGHQQQKHLSFIKQNPKQNRDYEYSTLWEYALGTSIFKDFLGNTGDQ
jgi:hypothetical protein